MTDKPFRPLALMVAAQLVLVAALLVWAGMGFPLPSALTGPEPTPATRSAPPAPPAVASGAGAGETSTGAGAVETTPADPAEAAFAPAPVPTVDHFSGASAFELLREQVLQYGWRPAGSGALRRLAVRLRSLLPAGRFEAIPGHPRLRNVVGAIPGRGKAIVIGAHYDVEARPKGFLGANDGAAGTAAVVWLARAMERAPRRAGDRPVRFVLFDGEEEPAGCSDFLQCGLRGSKAYAKRHHGELHSLVLLDYIAETHGLRFPREAGSDRRLWRKLVDAAGDVGVGRLFSTDTAGEILDDHTPFTQRGLKAIDVIDFDYASADTLADTLDKVSKRSVDAVGEAVYLLVTRLRRER